MNRETCIATSGPCSVPAPEGRWGSVADQPLRPGNRLGTTFDLGDDLLGHPGSEVADLGWRGEGEQATIVAEDVGLEDSIVEAAHLLAELAGHRHLHVDEELAA